MIKERLASLSPSNPVVLIENRVYNAAGEVRWLQFSNQGFFDANGALQEIQSVGRDITERMEAEAARQRHSSLLAAINRVLEMGLGRETEEQTCELFLELAEMVTSSRISFIGEIGTDGFLHDLAISNPAWDACSMRDKSGHRRLPGNLPIRGVLGRVLIDGRSLIVNDPASHPDWIGMPPGHPPLTNFMGVPLTREGSTVGLVAVGNREGDYSTEDLHALEAMARAIVEALGRKRAEEALRNSLNEKEVLLREVHHRVKNNMAAIVGLLNLQCRAINDPQFQAVITELTSRIRAMSIVHEKLYLSESLARVDFQEYLESLIFHLRTTFGSPRITCEVSAQGVNMPLDLAVPCGMIVNELITNALKYAFPQNSGKEGEDNCILVAMSQDNNICTLTVADNGIGLPAGFDLKQNTTLGLCLVDMLGSHQLGGRYDINNRGGTRFTLTFSLAR
jgi:two-component sensor histidine kinase